MGSIGILLSPKPDSTEGGIVAYNLVHPFCVSERAFCLSPAPLSRPQPLSWLVAANLSCKMKAADREKLPRHFLQLPGHRHDICDVYERHDELSACPAASGPAPAVAGLPLFGSACLFFLKPLSSGSPPRRFLLVLPPSPATSSRKSSSLPGGAVPRPSSSQQGSSFHGFSTPSMTVPPHPFSSLLRSLERTGDRADICPFELLPRRASERAR